MSRRPMRLRTRFLLSHTTVVAVAALVLLIVASVVTRAVYTNRLRGMGYGQMNGRGRGPMTVDASEGDLLSVLDHALFPALVAGTLAGLAAAALVAWLLGRRLAEPIEEVSEATRRIAAGDYTARVTPPNDAELASLAHDVNDLADRLATVEERRSQLLGEVTHELRTPLTIIGGTVEGLLDGVIAPDDEAFARIADETARLERLVGDLTLLSRSDEGAHDLHLVDGDLAAIATSAAERLRLQFEHEQVALEVVAPHPVPVRADHDRLVQVIVNLLGNALGHTDAGGTVTVTVTGSSDGAMGVVDVTDTGSGIAPDEIDRIFDRFYRGSAQRPDRPHRAGRGIGLTIARSLARAHGGDVTATSPGPGQGATFRLTIPR